MNKIQQKQHRGLYERLDILEEQHPYRFSFIIAALLAGYVVFFTPSFIDDTHNMDYIDSLDVINLEEIRTQKRSVKKEINTNTADTSEDADIDKAQGTNDDTNATDLSFLPNVVKPRPIGGIRKFYPKVAREKDVEAVVYTQVVISKEGRVVKISIKGVQILKTLPEETVANLKSQFIQSTKKSLLLTPFTPPVVQGKNVAVIVDFNIRYNLNE